MAREEKKLQLLLKHGEPFLAATKLLLRHFAHFGIAFVEQGFRTRNVVFGFFVFPEFFNKRKQGTVLFHELCVSLDVGDDLAVGERSLNFPEAKFGAV